MAKQRVNLTWWQRRTQKAYMLPSQLPAMQFLQGTAKPAHGMSADMKHKGTWANCSGDVSTTPAVHAVLSLNNIRHAKTHRFARSSAAVGLPGMCHRRQLVSYCRSPTGCSSSPAGHASTKHRV
jgi:hypothetical protein